jgi:hypothetical protein
MQQKLYFTSTESTQSDRLDHRISQQIDFIFKTNIENLNQVDSFNEKNRGRNTYKKNIIEHKNFICPNG